MPAFELRKGLNSTRRARPDFVGNSDLRPGLWQSPIESARVSDMSVVVRSISTCTDFVRGSGRVADKVCGFV